MRPNRVFSAMMSPHSIFSGKNECVFSRSARLEGRFGLAVDELLHVLDGDYTCDVVLAAFVVRIECCEFVGCHADGCPYA